MCCAWFQRRMFLVRKTKAFVFSCLVWIQNESLYPQGVLGENLFTMIRLCQLEIHVLFMFKETTIQWMYLKRSCKERPFFGFDKNHTILLKDKSLQFYMVMFSILFLYMCMYLIWEKAVSKYQHLWCFRHLSFSNTKLQALETRLWSE